MHDALLAAWDAGAAGAGVGASDAGAAWALVTRVFSPEAPAASEWQSGASMLTDTVQEACRQLDQDIVAAWFLGESLPNRREPHSIPKARI